ncbi:MAG TPA: chemotaxis response regulator protein-glutamate methylesterase [Ilumatobacter sp.]|nr:chemotaxis response regulator protein-glutamate methylesterase [Ilumatobacter sp.]
MKPVAASGGAPIRVLVVDDSVVIRRLVSSMIDDDPELEVVGVAANGKIALQRIRQLRPDIVTLDVEMPELDGLGTLAQLRPEFPNLPVVMFSTLTAKGAAATLDALAKGASDYVAKPANVGSVTEAMERVRDDLVPKLKALCRRSPVESRLSAPGTVTPLRPPTPRRAPASRVELVAIGSSTGGPNALGDVLSVLPGDLPVPVVIVQHMPAVFTRLLAERLDDRCAVRVREAADGDVLAAGHVYIAPGDYHLTVARDGTRLRLSTNQEPPVHFCRPSVDVMFGSLVDSVGAGVLAVVLTGMGSDGRDGAGALRASGAVVLAQDEPTSVVWGMPGAVVNAGLADEVLALSDVGPRIAAVVRGRADAGRNQRELSA